MNNQPYIKDLLQFIRDHRSNEINFEKLYAKWQEACQQVKNSSLGAELKGLEQEATAYRKAKEETGSAWPEFENFVGQFERLLVQEK